MTVAVKDKRTLPGKPAMRGRTKRDESSGDGKHEDEGPGKIRQVEGEERKVAVRRRRMLEDRRVE